MLCKKTYFGLLCSPCSASFYQLQCRMIQDLERFEKFLSSQIVLNRSSQTWKQSYKYKEGIGRLIKIHGYILFTSYILHLLSNATLI